MSVESEIHARAAAVTGLDDLISGRISEGRLEQNTTLPAIVYNRISAVPVSAMGSDVGLTPTTMQFGLYAATAAALRTLREQFLLAFQRWRTVSGSPRIQATFVDNMFGNPYDSDVKDYHQLIDCTFWAED